MNIEFGKTYYNKTWRFLVPCLKGHGVDFVRQYNSLAKLAVGIQDDIIDSSPLSKGRNIYSLINKRYNIHSYNKFIDYLKDKDYFKGEYIGDTKIVSAKKHMIVISIPKEYHNSYDRFIEGKYSEMYTKEQVSKLFPSPKKKEERKILLKIENGLENFIEKIKREFNENITDIESFREGEWELPLKKKEEIFNSKTNEVFIDSYTETYT